TNSALGAVTKIRFPVISYIIRAISAIMTLFPAPVGASTMHGMMELFTCSITALTASCWYGRREKVIYHLREIIFQQYINELPFSRHSLQTETFHHIANDKIANTPITPNTTPPLSLSISPPHT